MRKQIPSCVSEFRIHLSTSYSFSHHSGELNSWPSGINEDFDILNNLLGSEQNVIYQTKGNIYVGISLKIED